MIRNYLLVAYRNFRNSPLYLFINITGISIGLLACILIVRYVTFEYSYDNTLDNDIYRVYYSDNDGSMASVAVPAGPALASDISSVQAYTRFYRLGGIVKKDERSEGRNIEHMVMGDGDFLEMFKVQILRGDSSRIADPGYIFLSEKAASDFFGDVDPVGETLLLYEQNFGKMEVTVAAIFADWPLNSHIHIDGWLSLPTLNLYNEGSFWAKTDNWGWNSFYTYIKADRLPTSDQVLNLIDSYLGDDLRKNEGVEVGFQRVSSIHTHSNLDNEYAVNGNYRILNFLLVMAFFILVIAGVNYANLTSARGMQRSREVGIRKNLGASRWQLIGQFNLEALIILAISLVVAITIFQLIKPVAIQYFGPAFNSRWNVLEIGILLIFLLPVLLFTSFQPSWMMSAFSMTEVIKGKLGSKPKGKTLRNTSVVLQMMISILLIFSIITIYNQVSYMQNTSLGMNIDRVLVIERPKEGAPNYLALSEAFRNDLMKLGSVENVSLSGSVPGRGFNWGANAIHLKNSEDRVSASFSVGYIDNSYVETYDIEVLAGKAGYEGEYKTPRVMINATAAKELGFSDPKEAVGKVLVNGSSEFEILGVMADYYHNSIKELVPPTIMLFDQNPQYFSIKYRSGSDVLATTREVLAASREFFSGFFPEGTFEYFFMDDMFQAAFQKERNFGVLVLTFSVVAVFLSCIGLVGLSLFTLESRRKEMGIRKVMGASSFSLYRKLSGNISVLVLIAAVPAMPAAYFLASAWLENYPQKIELTWWHGVIPVLVLLLMTLGSVTSQYVKLSKTNPADTLRYE